VGRLIYSAITSLDGYVADAQGKFEWGAPDEEVHRFVNHRVRPAGTYLYGRRMYEVLAYWETVDPRGDQPAFMREFAEIWQAPDKIVYSGTLEHVSTARTRIERSFEPKTIEAFKAASERDLTVGGPELARQALAARLVDELQLIVAPVVVGGAIRWLAEDLRLELELVDEGRFSNGMTHLRYRIQR
jgi:dihydrofolate reductase